MSETRKKDEDLQVGGPGGGEFTGSVNAEIGDLRKLSELQGDKYTFVQSVEDIEQVTKIVGAADPAVTGAVVQAENGEFLEIWLSESSRPFELAADYTRVR
ncbi:hypothetical protein [Rhodoferax aquaticus]|uniref:Uncharacterized protein n=1 Tax=Rhodoferax aquaticus TaxID=2527691 RepID=A0A515EUS1_9BURK|nr:hypothetical protein [Rhodoferax aquaticus]QDL56432.1 hypothetical protein EXZ61_20985 [Rhodoferax aquaticus]